MQYLLQLAVTMGIPWAVLFNIHIVYIDMTTIGGIFCYFQIYPMYMVVDGFMVM